jgi:hypothetical protein
MEYIVQDDAYSCGPTAIINSLKWAGIGVTKEHLDLFRFSCRTIDPEFPNDWDSNGTTDYDLDRVLRYAGKGKFKVRKRSRPSLPMLIRHLQKGGAVVIAYYWKEGSESGHHFAFISGMKKGCFEVVNDHSGKGAGTLRRPSTLRKWLKRRDESPICWFIEMTV